MKKVGEDRRNSYRRKSRLRKKRSAKFLTFFIIRIMMVDQGISIEDVEAVLKSAPKRRANLKKFHRPDKNSWRTKWIIRQADKERASAVSENLILAFHWQQRVNRGITDDTDIAAFCPTAICLPHRLILSIWRRRSLSAMQLTTATDALATMIAT
ncbi:MAG: hypothetical protein ACLR6O_04805 [Eubacterium sp.]